MTDATSTYAEAYEATDSLLIAMDGLIHAACIISTEHPLLNTPDRESAALDTVLRMLEEKSAALRDVRSAEYQAGRALRKEAESSAAVERGK